MAFKLPDGTKDKILENVKQHFGVPGFIGDCLDEIVVPICQAYAESTKTPFDDMAVNLVKLQVLPPLKAEIKEAWDEAF